MADETKATEQQASEEPTSTEPDKRAEMGEGQAARNC